MRGKPALIFLLALLFSLNTQAEEKPKDRQPSLEILEFLGRWESADGKWLDPTTMEEMSKLQIKPVQGEPNEN
jgi:hypothetical protein